jgi:hypothetical protein
MKRTDEETLQGGSNDEVRRTGSKIPRLDQPGRAGSGVVGGAAKTTQRNVTVQKDKHGR